MNEQRKQIRAERILRILSAMLGNESLRRGDYGWTGDVARAMEVSAATASRDLALGRAILQTFAEKYGREYDLETDALVWSEDYSTFGFRTGESKKPVGNYLFRVEH